MGLSKIIDKLRKEKKPDSSDAEYWLTDSLFLCKGKVYEITITGVVKETPIKVPKNGKIRDKGIKQS